GAGVDVLDQRGAGGGAVALPQLEAVGAVVGAEEQRAADGGQVRGEGTVGAAVDVLEQHGAGGGAVALPQLDAVGAVAGGEEDDAADGGQVRGRATRRAAAGGAGVDVLDQHGAGRGAVALPELVAVDAVVGGEDQRAVEV